MVHKGIRGICKFFNLLLLRKSLECRDLGIRVRMLSRLRTLLKKVIRESEVFGKRCYHHPPFCKTSKAPGSTKHNMWDTSTEYSVSRYSGGTPQQRPANTRRLLHRPEVLPLSLLGQEIISFYPDSVLGKRESGVKSLERRDLALLENVKQSFSPAT